MAQTPSSSLTAYAAPSDMTARFDVRQLQDLTSDTNTPTASGSLAGNTRLLTCLLDASGMVEAAVSVGNRYSPADLQALAGAGQAFLVRLVCDLAMGLLFLARPDRRQEVPASYDRALESLELLRKGELVFGLLESKQAGNLGDHVETAREVEARGGVVLEAQRIFSRRNNRLHG